MSKSILSILLSSLFLLFLIAPTAILILDDTADVSFFYASSEEEETGNEGSEKNKEVELLSFELLSTDIEFIPSEVENNLFYFFKNYSKPHLNLISPPPDFIL